MRRFTSFGMPAFILFLGLLQSTSSQLRKPTTLRNREMIQGLYGSPVSEIYRTPQGLTVTTSFGSNGNLCRARIKSDAYAGITDKQLDVTLDELAPKDVRGEFKIGAFLNITCLKSTEPEKSMSSSKPSMQLEVDPCAECSGVSDHYERVNIIKYGNTNRYSSVQITFQTPECEGLDQVQH